MDNVRVKELIAELENAIHEIPHLSPEIQPRLDELKGMLQIDSPETSDFVRPLEEAAVSLDAEFPHISLTLRKLMDLLSSIGI